jgi:hypothetical protein
MELIKHGELFGKLESQLFIWDSNWESFRPIEKIGWNGKNITYSDYRYKQDLFDPWYGYGSSEMKQLCKRLIEIVDLGKYTEDITVLFKDTEWFRDRKVSFLPCAPKTPDSWLKYIKYAKSKARTLRTFKHSKKTKRIMPHGNVEVS